MTGNKMKKESLLSFEHANSRLRYQPESGVFSWKTNEGGVKIGDVAGCINSNGYLVVGLLGQKYRLHRLAWLLTQGQWPVQTIDHINCIRTDNRLCNLRPVSQAVNMQNIRTPRTNNTSGILGVYWSQKHGGFMASVSINKKKKRRGPYKTADRANAAYIDLKRIHHEGCIL